MLTTIEDYDSTITTLPSIQQNVGRFVRKSSINNNFRYDIIFNQLYMPVARMSTTTITGLG